MNKLIPAMKTYRIQEFRFLFCNKSSGSDGIRSYLQQYFTPVKQEFPQLPLLVREAQGHQALIIARFPNAKEVAAKVEGQTPEEIQQSIVRMLYSHHKAIGAPQEHFTQLVGPIPGPTIQPRVRTAVSSAAAAV